MNNKLTNPSVLALNAHWQAIDVYSAQKAIGMLAAGIATALDTSEGSFVPKEWEEWIKLEGQPGENSIATVKGYILIPRVVIAVNYKDLKPRVEPLTHETIARRQGYQCAYSGRALKSKNWSLDHILPRSRGGSDHWSNLVVADKVINSQKGARTPEEAGLSLFHKPKAPRKLLPKDYIAETHGIKFEEWKTFLQKNKT